ncbi:MAG: hypothetical protein IH598_13465 [Bacteroidales bacterium]|nr:hypothetical protein [Bacteroidales bacterium]
MKKIYFKTIETTRFIAGVYLMLLFPVITTFSGNLPLCFDMKGMIVDNQEQWVKNNPLLLDHDKNTISYHTCPSAAVNRSFLILYRAINYTICKQPSCTGLIDCVLHFMPNDPMNPGKAMFFNKPMLKYSFTEPDFSLYNHFKLISKKITEIPYLLLTNIRPIAIMTDSKSLNIKRVRCKFECQDIFI